MSRTTDSLFLPFYVSRCGRRKVPVGAVSATSARSPAPIFVCSLRPCAAGKCVWLAFFIIIYADLTMNSLLLIYLFYYYLFSQARNNRALMRYINSGAKSPVTYSVAAETRSTPRRRSNIPLYAFWMHIAAFS